MNPFVIQTFELVCKLVGLRKTVAESDKVEAERRLPVVQLYLFGESNGLFEGGFRSYRYFLVEYLKPGKNNICYRIILLECLWFEGNQSVYATKVYFMVFGLYSGFVVELVGKKSI